MRRFFNILLGALAMIAVALLSAFLTMRLAIHGREVEIPNVAGLTVAEANSMARGLGLNMNIENQFYSTVTPAGRVLSQSPAPGTKVRREWVLRVTESSGPQRVSVPNVVGTTEREASVTIRRLALELGTVAYIPAPGPAGIVLSQTPTPAAAGVDGPRISLLVSEPVAVARLHQMASAVAADEANQSVDASVGAADAGAVTSPSSAAATEAGTAANATVASPAIATDTVTNTNEAYVMPSLIGLTLSAASARVNAMGLHITSMEVVASNVRPIAPITSPSAPGSSGPPAPVRPIAPITLSNTVVSQTPAAGHRVTKADMIHITLSH